ncbi:penicillin-binding protein activator LpoB [Azonexus hydrophilus]|jgi:penicillin-binding protein activator|uniref:penicillin-binding protein activator LpoB n=1 Tax=Azonexus hydrophilus TaxID=418702 RepID=UPI001767CB8C|nr:penicillin-binding protein activator LpoB [Azonexus hydrophilus]MBP8022418.1 penicillin-binding protein activator LpoB [Azonexus sp.]MBP8821590.1 penicillin-binding protein activator LpoB [Brachymonas sp.]MDX9736521.1 penicillin-binding protein activator LpoB [Azonexus sp.]HHV48804.1 penicillin-binding protein activator LpoB [Rhodocyclaceae bacterium]
MKSASSSRALLLATVLGFSLSACQTTSPTLGDGSVSYGDAKAVEAVTTDLGSTDIQMTSEKMTQSMIQHPVIQTAIRKRELLMASPVKNKTSEYFDTRLITDTILTQLQKNGIRYVIEGEDMQNQVDELRRQNQSGLYKKSKTAKMGNMQGAKYRIDGSVSSIVKRNSSMKDVYYKINMRLIEIESGIVEWSDEKEIRKSAKR